MFPTSINNHQMLHNVRQHELEAEAQAYRQAKVLKATGEVSPLRQRVGGLLIELGKKVAQEPQQDVRLALSARH